MGILFSDLVWICSSSQQGVHKICVTKIAAVLQQGVAAVVGVQVQLAAFAQRLQLRLESGGLVIKSLEEGGFRRVPAFAILDCVDLVE